MERLNENGTLSVTEKFFAKVVCDAFEAVSGDLYLVATNGKVISGVFNQVPSIGEVLSNALLEINDDTVNIELDTVLRFGASIKEVSTAILNHVCDTISGVLPEVNVSVILKIIGVKSKDIAPRDLEFSKVYVSDTAPADEPNAADR